MAQEGLVEYIKRLFTQGYDIGTVRTTLLNAGYSPYEVDTAIRAAGTGRHISTRTLIIVFVSLLALAGIVLITLKLMQPEPVVLSFSLSLFSSEVAPGQDVVANVDIFNPSGRETSGLIDLTITGPDISPIYKTESFSVITQTSVPSAIPLPFSTPPGAYTLTATFSYGDMYREDSLDFDVVEDAPAFALPADVLVDRAEEEARVLQLTCPGGCDDLNFCTSDSCIKGVCVNTPIVPCCGNANCEAGETDDSCMLDCGERRVAPEDIIENAKAIAAADVSKAMSVCDTLAQRVYIDACLGGVAEVSESQEPCTKVIDDDARDSCYIPFAYKNDFSVCSKLTNPYMKNSCISLSEISKLSEEV